MSVSSVPSMAAMLLLIASVTSAIAMRPRSPSSSPSSASGAQAGDSSCAGALAWSAEDFEVVNVKEPCEAAARAYDFMRYYDREAARNVDSDVSPRDREAAEEERKSHCGDCLAGMGTILVPKMLDAVRRWK